MARNSRLFPGLDDDWAGPADKLVRSRSAPGRSSVRRDYAPTANAPLQRKPTPGGKATAASDPTAIAADGVRGTGTTLPHLDLIQRAFAPHDVSNVRAQVGGAAAAAAKGLDAEAYATGNSVAFRSQPDLHTAAHEAAHVVQQRGGVQLKGGVGQAGDSYEQHADAVADLVVSGKSAAGLLDTMAGGAVQSGHSGPVQKKKGDSKKDTAGKANAAPVVPTEELKAAMAYTRSMLADRVNTSAIVGTKQDEKDLRGDANVSRKELEWFVETARQELAYRKKHNGAALNLIDNNDYDEWARAFGEMRSIRHLLAGSMSQHWRAEIKTHGKKYRAAIARLKANKASLERIKKAEEDADEAVELTKLVVEIGEYGELAEHSGKLLVKVESKAIDAAGVAAAGYASMKIGKKAELIEMGVRNLANYTVQLAVATEGVASVDELLTRLKSATREVKNEARELAYAQRMLAKTTHQQND